MKNLLKTAAVMAVVTFPLSAEQIMKITLNSDIQEEKIADISKVFFDSGSMIAGSLYNLDDIKKIEFYDDGTAILQDNNQQSSASIQAGQIGFTQIGKTIQLNSAAPSHMNVALYSMNGRKVAELFDGQNSGILSLSLEKQSLATGIYSIVVKTNSNLFVRKLMVK